MSISVRLLGSFEVVTAHGTRVNLGSPKQRAVLALLVLNVNRVVALERMIHELWGEEPPMRADATIHAYISNLRKALEPDRAARSPSTLIVSRAPGYVLTLDPAQIDAVLFEQQVERARALATSDPGGASEGYREALAMWRGGALADFSYETFAAAEIARLEELRINAIEDRLAAELASGKASELVAELERLLTEHPLRERLWSHLMLALYRSGRQAEALRAYRRCVDRLGEELGIEPGNELRRLEELILNQDPSLDPSSVLAVPLAPAAGVPLAAGSAPATAGDSDLVGRELEMAIFRHALVDAALGTGSVIFLEGEPGIGKTRLLEAMHQEALTREIPASLARCVEVGGTPAFWPWIQLSRGMMEILGVDTLTAAAGPYARYLAPAFPELRPRPGRGDPPGLADAAPHRVAEGILWGITELTKHRPMVMLIDDLYGADPDSYSVLTLMSADIARLGLVIVCTYRSTDLPPEHPLADALAQMARMDRVTRLPLKRLTEDETGDVIEQLIGSRPDQRTVAAIHTRTDGNAFFTVELTRLLAAEGDLTYDRCMAATVPSTVRDVLRQRLARLDEPTFEVLQVAAVAGRRWDLDIVTGLVDLPASDVFAAVDNAVEAGVISEDGRPGRYRFSHVLVGDAVALSLGALRRAQIHNEIARALEARHGSESRIWSEIAHHAVEAVAITGASAAIPPLARAGREALDAHAHELAEELFQKRLDLIESLPPAPAREQDEIGALLDLSLVWSWREGYHSERLARASKRLLDLAAKAGETISGKPQQLVSVILPAFQARISQEIVSGNVAETAHTVKLLDELTAADPDPTLACMAHLNTVVVSVHIGDTAEATKRADQAETLVDQLDPGLTGTVMLPLGQQNLVSTHYAFAGWARWLAGQPERARAHFEVARAAADRADHLFSAGFVTAVEILVAGMEGDPAWASDSIAWARSHDGIEDFALTSVWMDAGQAWADGCLGDSTGLDRLRRAVATLEEMGALVCHTEYWGMIAELELLAAEPEQALTAARTGLEHVQRRGEGYWYPELERLAAVALNQLGRPREAEEALARSEESARAKGIVPLAERIRKLRLSLEDS